MKKQIDPKPPRAVILAAGKGARMKPLTQSLPKCLAIRIGGKSLLEMQIETFKACGLRDIVIVRGYKGEKISFGGVRYVWNRDYENNNVLESLFCAKDELRGSVIVSYSDIWYEKNVVEKLLKVKGEIVLAVDVNWKNAYEGRRDHPPEEAENVVFDPRRRVLKIGKIAASEEEVHGEFVGLMKLTDTGCRLLKKHYERAKQLYDHQPFQRAALFRQAYLTDLLQEMADSGVPIQCDVTEKRWREIDTMEDFARLTELFSEPKPQNHPQGD